MDERIRREEEEARRREERLEAQLKEEKEKREKLERLREKRRKRRKEKKKKEFKDQPDEVPMRSEKNDAKLCEEDLEVSEKDDLDDTVVQTSSKIEDRPRKRREVVDQLRANEKKKSETAGRSQKKGLGQIEGTANALEAWKSPKSVQTKRRSMSEAREEDLAEKIHFEAPVTELLSEGEEDSVTEDESEREERILQPAISGLSLKSDHVYEAPQSLEDLVNGLDGGVDRLERNKDIVVKALGQKMVELGLHPDTSHLSGL